MTAHLKLHPYTLIFFQKSYKNNEPHFCSRLRTIETNEAQSIDGKKKKDKGNREETE